MKISTKARYGLRAMLELALRHDEGPVLMGLIAKTQGISRKYLHTLLTTLKNAGLVQSVRGSGGGYMLAKHPNEINLSEILSVLEGPLNFVDCVGNRDLCTRADSCVTRDVWVNLFSQIHNTLSNITLEALVVQHREKMNTLLMYHI